MGRKGYSVEFRRRALELVAAGRPIIDVVRDLVISSQSMYRWQRHDRIDEGLEPGATSAEAAELAAVKRRIVQLEAELAVANKAVEPLTEATDPEGGSRRSVRWPLKGSLSRLPAALPKVTCGG